MTSNTRSSRILLRKCSLKPHKNTRNTITLLPLEYIRLLECTRRSKRPGAQQYYTLWVVLGNLGLSVTAALRLTVGQKVQVPYPFKVSVVVQRWVRHQRLGRGDRLFPMTREAVWQAFCRYRTLAKLPQQLNLRSLKRFYCYFRLATFKIYKGNEAIV